MDKIYKGTVVKKISDNFWVKVGNQVYLCNARGNLKSSGLFVGDNVEIEAVDNKSVISKIYDRINLLIRPPLANLQQLIIVIASTPKIDYNIVDKLILFCFVNNIKPILCLNKIDISFLDYEYIKNVYSNICQLICVSAKTGENIEKLTSLLKNKISAFAGQSAVGKSALINAIFKDNLSLEGSLSEKIEKGKNTTRHCEIFYNDDLLICDTSGFTSLDENLLPIPYYELMYYYPDFINYQDKCKYSSCTHFKENEKECAVKTAVANNIIDKQRYLRYCKIYETLKAAWIKNHG